ncbi:MAG TPA: anti-sigma-D factor RsdA [Pseudonocardiaceae bacterium]|nr:anti-sigma-D factor RsdA [Pseudonocardiaceae bacterium]
MSGRDDDPRAGHRNGNTSEIPVDLAAVQADDALLDMLGGAGRTPGDTDIDVDGELASVLVAWRREVHVDSNRLLVDTDTALAVISAARRPARRRGPLFGPIAAAATVLVIAFSAVGLVAKSAQPNDQLWGVTQVLYPEYARSVEAAAFVRTELNKADAALREGHPEQAKASLQRIQQQLPVIAEAEGRTDLTARHHELERELVTDPSVQGSPPESPDASSPEQPAAPAPETSSTTIPTESSSTVEPSSSPEVEPSSSPAVEPKPAPPAKPNPPPAVEPKPAPAAKPNPPTVVKPNPPPRRAEPSASTENGPERPPGG